MYGAGTIAFLLQINLIESVWGAVMADTMLD